MAEHRQGKASEVGADEVQKRSDEASEQGYYGTTFDPTPNENYSLETGQDAPTPETDPKLAEQVGSKRFFGHQTTKQDR